MYIIIPTTAISKKPIKASDKNQWSKPKPIMAPIGSVIPVQNEYQMALRFIPVAWYIGSATAIPSGILCKAIAIATEAPKAIF